jgi:hypothetical protein
MKPLPSSLAVAILRTAISANVSSARGGEDLSPTNAHVMVAEAARHLMDTDARYLGNC